MYLGIDVGGSKALVAAFSEDGQVSKESKFPTNASYQAFLKDLEGHLSEFKISQIRAVCCAVPAVVKDGVGLRFGNLAWHNVPIQADVSKLLGGLPVKVANDAVLAALYEARLVQNKYKRVLYVTIGTGIGAKLIINGVIDSDSANSEAGFMVLEHEGKLEEWEEFASGQAIVKQYGKKAAEINDPAIWQQYAYHLAEGLQPLLADWYPDVVIIGGGVGAHFEKFEQPLQAELVKFQSHMVTTPPIVKAQRPEEAVIYGCYEFIKQNR